MDAIDNPDHGRRIYANGIVIEEHPFDRSKALHDPVPAPAGGPMFPALADVQISSTPT